MQHSKFIISLVLLGGIAFTCQRFIKSGRKKIMADVQDGTKNPPVDDNDSEREDETCVPAGDDAGKENENEAPAKTPAKKPTSKSPSSPKISYVALVQEAIENLMDRTGSSQVAIQKYIMTNHPEVPADKLKQRLLHTLKTGCGNKRFMKIKASFKIHPDVIKKKATLKKNSTKKETDRKSLSKEDLAALREKERMAAKEKERLDLIRKRKFPMDDLELIKEDKELKVVVSLPPRPTLPLALPEFPSVCKSDTMGSGILDDAFHVYHFFRGDVGWGRFSDNRNIVAPFTLHQWLECILQVIRGGAKKSRMLPPLMTHLFVVALQHLVPKELLAALTPSSWSEVLMLYMDAMERYYTTEASLDSGALPGIGIDVEYLLHITDEQKDESSLTPPTGRESNFYLQGPLSKIQDKLFTNDPWMLSAEELLALLKALVDDLLATKQSCSQELDDRLQDTYELLKTKREADALFRKLQNQRRKEENEKKESEDQGEKPTRSSMKLPSVSDAKLESARRNQQKATDAFEKACRSKRVRTEPIGEDRYFNSFYHFWNDPERVFVAQRNKAIPSSAPFHVPGASEMYRTTWHSIDKRSVLEKYIESFDVRGKREQALKEGLDAGVKTVFDDIKAMNEKKAFLKGKQDLQNQLENARLKCEVGRKSGRLAAQSEQEFFDLQSEIENLEKIIEGDEMETPKPDLETATGLVVLRDFDRREETSQRRRTTKRGGLKQEEEEEGTKLPIFKCSKLWSTGNIDGTGVVGSIVWDLLELEERIEKLAPWDKDRQNWISGLETAGHSWHVASPPLLEEEKSSSSLSKGSPGEPVSDTKKQRRLSGEVNTQSVHQVLAMLKQPILLLEQRVFEMTGLAMAFQDSIDADENMSASPDDENKEEQFQVEWKRLVYRLQRLPAKAHSRIRHLVVDAIAAARKAQQSTVVAQLREALLQFHPEAAGACKAAALKVLEKYGGYDEEDDDDEDDEDQDLEDEDDVRLDEQQKAQSEAGLSSVLSFEGVILNSCLDGQEDASRADWIAAVKKCKTVAKLGALAAAFCSKASEKLDKIENEKLALYDALDSWKKSSSLRKKSSKLEKEPTEVWTHVTFTDDFCLAKVDDFPWWPAKKCIVKDTGVAGALASLGRSVVSLVGESGGLRVLVNEMVVPYSETHPDQEELNSHPKDVRSQLEDCRAMARRIIRGKDSKTIGGSRRKNIAGVDELKDEKKISI